MVPITWSEIIHPPVNVKYIVDLNIHDISCQRRMPKTQDSLWPERPPGERDQQ